MSRPRRILIAAAVGLATAANAQDEEMPDLDFLEYLGSWEESDEDWVVVAEEFLGRQAGEEEAPPVTVGAETDAASEEDEEADGTDED